LSIIRRNTDMLCVANMGQCCSCLLSEIGTWCITNKYIQQLDHSLFIYH
jgi:hypothetical protein